MSVFSTNISEVSAAPSIIDVCDCRIGKDGGYLHLLEKIKIPRLSESYLRSPVPRRLGVKPAAVKSSERLGAHSADSNRIRSRDLAVLTRV